MMRHRQHIIEIAARGSTVQFATMRGEDPHHSSALLASLHCHSPLILASNMHHHDFESVFSRAQAVRKGGSGRRSLSCADGDGDGDLNSIQKLQVTSSKSPLRVFEMQSSQQQEHK